LPRQSRAAAPEDGSEAPEHTLTSRRREIGSASARSLLLTVLGEFVHPRSEPVWTGSLVTALAMLGVEEKAARQSLARSAAAGLLIPRRHGRRVQWELAGAGRRLLDDGTRRIYGFMRAAHRWDGRWLLLSVAIPETQRQLRHRLRTRLTWLGLGSPTPGLWVTPDAAKEAEVAAVIAELGLREQTYAWVGTTSSVGDHTRIINDAWQLEDVVSGYQDFIAAFETRPADSDGEAFVAQVQMVHDWRRFPGLDPDLPSELLDHDWPGPRAAAVFHDRHGRWERKAQAEWERLASMPDLRLTLPGG
jgi:phenylacetic acid degradation operon negative regulatory protein